MSLISIEIEDEWIKTAQWFGNIKDFITEALKSYSVEQCISHIKDISAKIAAYNKKYLCNYETFTNAVQTDKEFLMKIESQNPLWEEDAMEWEYWHEEYRAWQNRLEVILQQ
ncbi:MAG TPA: hypothetical protein DCQ37_14180 [Desulfobacteraceae bacterium]|nr:hypothetical protein [Desulfobacteraceae bacterium]